MSHALPKTPGVYEIVNLVNGKRYVGSSVDTRKRWRLHRHHLARGTHHSPHLQSSWAKHGPDAFAFRVLLVCAREHLVAYEQAILDRSRPVFNVAPRANLPNGVPISDAGRKRLSERMRGNTNTLGYRHSAESLALLSASKLGNTHTKGRPRSPGAVAKTAAAHRGMKRSDETRARISAAMAGRKQGPRSAEWCASLSAAQKGRRNSPESIEKMRATKKGQRLSPEHRAKIGMASLAAWARRKAAAAEVGA